MSLHSINVEITGTEALLMHRFPMEEIERLEKKSKEDQARLAAYIEEDGTLFVPALNIQRMLISAAGYSKGKGKASLKKEVGACVKVMPGHVSLKTKVYEIDSRPVVIKSTQGRIVRHRPRIAEGWKLTFELSFDDQVLMEKQLRRIVDDAGKFVGLLDYRPERNGYFGTFMVTRWGE